MRKDSKGWILFRKKKKYYPNSSISFQKNHHPTGKKVERPFGYLPCLYLLLVADHVGKAQEPFISPNTGVHYSGDSWVAQTQ